MNVSNNYLHQKLASSNFSHYVSFSRTLFFQLYNLLFLKFFQLYNLLFLKFFQVYNLLFLKFFQLYNLLFLEKIIKIFYNE
jgi:hypothetical protein